jgi:hypothetical protein
LIVGDYERGHLTVDVVVERKDGTVMRLHEQPKYGGRMRGSSPSSRRLGAPVVPAGRPRDLLVPDELLLLRDFAEHFKGRQDEALRVARLASRPRGDEIALKHDVMRWASSWRAHGSREPLAKFLGVSTRAITGWRQKVSLEGSRMDLRVEEEILDAHEHGDPDA